MKRQMKILLIFVHNISKNQIYVEDRYKFGKDLMKNHLEHYVNKDVLGESYDVSTGYYIYKK